LKTFKVFFFSLEKIQALCVDAEKEQLLCLAGVKMHHISKDSERDSVQETEQQKF